MSARARRRLAGRRHQRGVASLVVVMVLLFIVSLAAAYTNRNLIFEQKASANQMRGMAAFEAAEAGVEWTLALLNGGAVEDASCLPGAGATRSFRERYVQFDAAGVVSHAAARAAAALNSWPTCVFNGNDWTCACPDTSAASVSMPTAAGPLPAFRLFPAAPESGPPPLTTNPYAALGLTRAGLLPVSSVGCTRLPTASGDNCLDFLPRGDTGDGVAVQRVMLMLRPALNVPPATPLTAGGGVSPAVAPSPPLRVENADLDAGGITVRAGGAVDAAAIVASSVPGTPGELTLRSNDAELAERMLAAAAPPTPLPAGERLFVSVFGAKRDTYRQQPGLRVCASPCSAAAINAILADQPDRVIWVEGDLTLDADVGTPPPAANARPAMLIVDGSVLTLGSGVNVYGLVYLTTAGTGSARLVLPAAATSLRGALLVEGALSTEYPSGTTDPAHALTLVYDRLALMQMRHTYGSWVRAPGGWRDYRQATP